MPRIFGSGLATRFLMRLAYQGPLRPVAAHALFGHGIAPCLKRLSDLKVVVTVGDPLGRRSSGRYGIWRWLTFDGRHPCIDEIIGLAKEAARVYGYFGGSNTDDEGRPPLVAFADAPKYTLTVAQSSLFGTAVGCKTLYWLALHGELRTKEIVTMRVTRSAPREHLCSLETSGLVMSEFRDGGRYWRLNPAHAIAVPYAAALRAVGAAMPNESARLAAFGMALHKKASPHI